MGCTIVDDHEICWDGRTVWINGPDGMCVGRFGPAGIDIHLDFKGQSETGQQCLSCSKDPDWARFRSEMLEHYKIAVPQEARPGWV